MTKKGKKKRAKAPDISKAAAASGGRILGQIRDQFNVTKNPANPKQSFWSILSEIQQLEILDRFRKVIEAEVTRCVQEVMANEYPAVHATLSKVAFGSKAIQGSLDIPFGSAHRHALADFSGRQVLVILADDLEAYLASMDKIKPDRDQKDLPLEDHGQDDSVDDDPRTMDELKESAGTLAEEIGEKDVAGLVGDWDREHLVDYINYAEKKKAGGKAAEGEQSQVH